MSRANWVWYGHVGHLIVGRDCKYHLNTYVNGYIVSTVGEYVPDREILRIIHSKDHELITARGDEFDRVYYKKYGCEEIGCDRKYETMVFIAKKCNCGCDEYVSDRGGDVEFSSYNTSKDAFAGHVKMCELMDNGVSPFSLQNTPDWKKGEEQIKNLIHLGVIEEYESEEMLRKLTIKLLKGEL